MSPGISAWHTDPDADPGLPCGRERNYGWRIADKGHTLDRALSNTQIDAVLVRIGIRVTAAGKRRGYCRHYVKYHIDLAVDGGAYSTVMTKTVTENSVRCMN
jgi:predicted phage tail protein